MTNAVITGVGSYIPKVIINNEDFLQHEFYDASGEKINKDNKEVIEKLNAITGIKSRRYLQDNMTCSDMGAEAASAAIKDADIDPESLDYIIVAHNFGDIQHDNIQSNQLPTLASKVKHELKIQNPGCVAYDILYGCPGWVEGMIQAYAFMKAGMAKKCLVIGNETLSRIVDPHDRDTMIYADGAGACVLELKEENSKRGILSVASETHTYEEAYFLFMAPSYKKNLTDHYYMKMHGRKIYEFALNNVPRAMANCLDSSELEIADIKKVLMHQANEKMDEAIVKRFFRHYKAKAPEGAMPMSIKELGNSSVATIPTLLDLILKNKLEGHQINEGDAVIFASVGAGMNINAITYKF